MTREERLAKLAELRTEAETAVKAYNAALTDGNLDESMRANAIIEEKVGEYTTTARILCYEDCKATEDPMLTAVKMLTFETIVAKDEKVGEEKIAVRKIIEKERAIDLLALDKYCGGIGADKNWVHIAQKMNFLLTAQKCVDLGVDPKSVSDSYLMSEIARGFDMGKNPVSKTNLLKTLQIVVTAMVGEGYKATSHDVNYLMAIYAKKGRKALSVSCANHRYFRNYMAEVCHRIVTGGTYSVESKEVKTA